MVSSSLFKSVVKYKNIIAILFLNGVSKSCLVALILNVDCSDRLKVMPMEELVGVIPK